VGVASRSIAVVAVTLLTLAALRAQQPPAAGSQPPAPAQNLKVLARDMPQAQLLQVMLGFTQALGVQCGYCHAAAPPATPGPGAPAPGRGGRGGPAPFDFQSDDKPQKRAAREMMLMVRDINPKVAAAVGKPTDAATRVACVTCHRGVAIPKQLADILDQTAMEKGTPAAIAQYKDLRKQYFGAQAYDFTEGSLVTYATRATQANKPDDAIPWLRLNLEYYPASSRTYAALSQVEQRRNDKDAAIRNLEKAIDLDPQNAPLKRQLDQLKTP
jgi:hypothetical protein